MRRSIGIVTLALGLGFGCSRAVEGERETLYQAESALVIRVVNRSQADLAIYLVHDGARERLGTVTAASTATFPVRAGRLATGDFSLLADPVGSARTSTSETLHVGQGTEFTWTLEGDLRRGSVLIRD